MINNKSHALSKKIIFAIKAVIGKKCNSIHEPTLQGNELIYLQKCIKTNFVSSVGPYVKKFESVFSRFVNCKYGVTTTSGTTALHLACKTLGIEN